jgi:NADPH-dependent ferric siderophore reductase
MSDAHEVTRIRHEVRRRPVTVKSVARLTPNMVRVVFTGDSLEGFASLGYDDHVKLVFPPAEPGLAEGDPPLMRDFTPRRYDAAARELTIDFALHETGPASDWACRCRPGSRLEIGGPRSSFVVPDAFDWYLFAGDETALPAIGRRLEELRAGVRVVVVAAVVDKAEEQDFRSAADVTFHWVHRPTAQGADPARLLSALRGLILPPGDGYAWVAAEARVARALRQYLVAERGLDKARVKAAGYWRQGGAGVHERLDD